jgi:hypothetical protein
MQSAGVARGRTSISSIDFAISPVRRAMRAAYPGGVIPVAPGGHGFVYDATSDR